MSALVWWLIPLFACIGALIYVWWSVTAKNRQNTYKSIAEYENFRSAFNKKSAKQELLDLREREDREDREDRKP
jgi:hypothetical protein